MLLPIAIGILSKRFCPKAAERIHKVLSKVAFPALILLATIFFIQHHETIAAQIGRLGLCITMMILLAMGGGYLISRLMKLTAQSIAIASSPFIFNNDIIAIPAIIYALMMNVILLVYVGIVKRR